MSLRLEQVSFTYGDIAVIDDLSMDLEKGVFYGILGPNGSGKTTLLDLLTGLRKPSKGQIRYRGRPIGDVPRKQLAKEMALVPMFNGAASISKPGFSSAITSPP